MSKPKPNTMDDWIEDMIYGGGHMPSNIRISKAKALITAKLNEAFIKGTYQSEVWREAGYGWGLLYEVSSAGRVRSIKRRTTIGKLLKPALFGGGYCRVAFNNGEVKETLSVHRLVAEAFLPNPNNLPQVNHKNGIKADNTVNNLEWCTASENRRHAYSVLGGSPPNKGKHRDVCRKGHKMTEENTYISKGKHHCRQCRKVSSKIWRNNRLAELRKDSTSLKGGDV